MVVEKMESRSNEWRTNGKNHMTCQVGGGGVVVVRDSHGGQIPAANAAAWSGEVAVTAATAARGGVPFAEGPPTFSTAGQQKGGLHRRGLEPCGTPPFYFQLKVKLINAGGRQRVRVPEKYSQRC